MNRIMLGGAVGLVLLLSGCGGRVGGGDASDAGSPPHVGAHDAGGSTDIEDGGVEVPADAGSGFDAGFDGGVQVVTHTPHERALLNPERGIHRWLSMSDGANAYAQVRAAGSSLGILVVRLDAFRASEISAQFLSDLEQKFGHARAAGLKLVLKFSYNDGPYPNSQPDASEARILGHIAQLQPVLADNADVIAFVQAGFIGAWGEWHTSTNGLLDFAQRPDAARNILTALLDALPEGHFVQLRYPAHKAHFYGDSPIDSSRAFSSDAKARVGHHNDCFLANATDHGTYSPLSYSTTQVEKWKALIAEDGRFAPVGGETCETSTFSGCANALQELARQRYTYLNHDYHPDVISGWKGAGCFDEIARRLGYRLALLEVAAPQRARAGESFELQLRLRNDGFAAPVKPRPVFLVLHRDGAPRVELPLLDVDPRRWLPGEHAVDLTLSLPMSVSPGAYALSLWMPDASPSLRARSEYAVQWANDGWDAATGLHALGVTVQLE